MPLADEPPALEHEAQLLLAADHGSLRRDNVGRGLPQDLERLDRLRDPLEPVRSERAAGEVPRDQALGHGADDEAVGLGQALQACRQVRGLADDGVRLARLPAAHLADDDEAGVDADADLEADA